MTDILTLSDELCALLSKAKVLHDRYDSESPPTATELETLRARHQSLVERCNPNIRGRWARACFEVHGIQAGREHQSWHECGIDIVKRYLGQPEGSFVAFLSYDSESVNDFVSELRREANAAITLEKSQQAEKNAGPFVPTDLQEGILAALNGRALKKEALANAVCAGEASRLYRARKKRSGDLNELIDKGLVINKRGLGYYRPDVPPSSTPASAPALLTPPST